MVASDEGPGRKPHAIPPDADEALQSVGPFLHIQGLEGLRGLWGRLPTL